MSQKDKPDPPEGYRLGESAQPVALPRSLDRRALLRVALKLFILEALWNPRGQQSLGLLTVIDKPLAAIYAGRPAALKEARKRNLDFFNTNPIASGLVVGALLTLEEEQAAGLISPKTERNLVQALASTLAAEGDQLFWQSWLPLCCLTGVLVTVLTGYLWAPLLIPVLFCALAWPVRVWGVFKGYELGSDVYRIYQLSHGERLIWAIQWLWLLILAVLTAMAVVRIFTPLEATSRWALPWVLLSIFALWLYKRVTFGHLSILSWLLYPVMLLILLGLTIILV
ncbi:MAG: PTS system mannose/fructose/sorbose family transporter subunit IID [Deltaproteobacteria bacterium]|jgi:PTS system mannose-specific IID component|nr:PTS system mannose/fructose/sorbose family transporter subunit IID [Deltaproteobacteria bacterium]